MGMDREDLLMMLEALRRVREQIGFPWSDKPDVVIAVCAKHPLEDHAAFILQELGGMAGAW